MEFFVEPVELLEVGRGLGSSLQRDVLAKTFVSSVINALRGDSDGRALQGLTRELGLAHVPQADLRHERPQLRRDLDEPVCTQLNDRLSDRCPTDTELSRKFCLGESLPWRSLQRDDRGPKSVVDLDSSRAGGALAFDRFHDLQFDGFQI